MVAGYPFDFDKVANDVAMKWFEVHAEQRLKLLNFFLIIVGFCIAGYFAALQARNGFAASIIALLLTCVCLCFKQLDRRTTQLLKLAEDYLRESLAKLAVQIDSNTINFVERAEQKGSILSYRQVFNILFWLFGVLGILGAILPWFQTRILDVTL
jgi:uncharacterized membrane protein YbaN (DUF454 family)